MIGPEDKPDSEMDDNEPSPELNEHIWNIGADEGTPVGTGVRTVLLPSVMPDLSTNMESGVTQPDIAAEQETQPVMNLADLSDILSNHFCQLDPGHSLTSNPAARAVLAKLLGEDISPPLRIVESPDKVIWFNPLVPNGPILTSVSSSERALCFTPRPDQPGTFTFTLQKDGRDLQLTSNLIKWQEFFEPEYPTLREPVPGSDWQYIDGALVEPQTRLKSIITLDELVWCFIQCYAVPRYLNQYDPFYNPDVPGYKVLHNEPGLLSVRIQGVTFTFAYDAQQSRGVIQGTFSLGLPKSNPNAELE